MREQQRNSSSGPSSSLALPRRLGRRRSRPPNCQEPAARFLEAAAAAGSALSPSHTYAERPPVARLHGNLYSWNWPPPHSRGVPSGGRRSNNGVLRWLISNFDIHLNLCNSFRLARAPESRQQVGRCEAIDGGPPSSRNNGRSHVCAG